MKYKDKIKEIDKDPFIIDIIMISAPITTLESVNKELIHPELKKEVETFINKINSIVEKIKESEVENYGKQENTEETGKTEE